MKLSSLVLPLILFTGIMVGFQSFGSNLYDRSGVDAEGLSSVETEQENLESKWVEEGGDQSTWREEEGIVERSTGAILIPRIATDIIGVGQTMNQIVNEVSDYRWVPSWADTMIRSVIGASVFFALVGGYLRFRS